MAFTRFDARLTKVSYADAAKAWLKVRADRTLSLCISLSGALASNWEALDAVHVAKQAKAEDAAWCEVFVGDGDDAGQLQLLFCFGPGRSEEAIDVRGGVHGLRRLTMLAPPGLPQADLAAEACRIVERGETLTLELPIAAWERRRGRPEPAKPAAEPAAAERPAAAPPLRPSRPAPPLRAPEPDPIRGDKLHQLDAVRYLGRKGVVIIKGELGQYLINGVEVPDAEVLKQVNAHRRLAKMPEITLSDLA